MALVADNGHMDQFHRSRGQRVVRLWLVEDMRPDSTLRHLPWAGNLLGDVSAMLCYHGHLMHFLSSLSWLEHMKGPFTLRVILSLENVNRLRAMNLNMEGIQMEVIQYTSANIYNQLKDCDVGLAPMEVQPRKGVSFADLSKATADQFIREDSFPEDTVRRCKRTSNGGRMFMFFQLGVPTVTDACADAIAVSRYSDEPTALIAMRPEMWPKLTEQLLGNSGLRQKLSFSSRSFADTALTTKRQAAVLLDKLSCHARSRPLQMAKSMP